MADEHNPANLSPLERLKHSRRLRRRQERLAQRGHSVMTATNRPDQADSRPSGLDQQSTVPLTASAVTQRTSAPQSDNRAQWFGRLIAYRRKRPLITAIIVSVSLLAVVLGLLVVQPPQTPNAIPPQESSSITLPTYSLAQLLSYLKAVGVQITDTSYLAAQADKRSSEEAVEFSASQNNLRGSYQLRVYSDTKQLDADLFAMRYNDALVQTWTTFTASNVIVLARRTNPSALDTTIYSHLSQLLLAPAIAYLPTTTATIPSIISLTPTRTATPITARPTDVVTQATSTVSAVQSAKTPIAQTATARTLTMSTATCTAAVNTSAIDPVAQTVASISTTVPVELGGLALSGGTAQLNRQGLSAKYTASTGTAVLVIVRVYGSETEAITNLADEFAGLDAQDEIGALGEKYMIAPDGALLGGFTVKATVVTLYRAGQLHLNTSSALTPDKISEMLRQLYSDLF